MFKSKTSIPSPPKSRSNVAPFEQQQKKKRKMSVLLSVVVTYKFKILLQLS